MNGLLVGRFQPFHLGHVTAVTYALERCESLWLCIGSVNVPRDAKDPFSVEERQEMIESSLSKEILGRVRIYHIADYDDHKKWMDAITETVPEYGIVFTNDESTSKMLASDNCKTSNIEFYRRQTLEGRLIRSAIASGGNLDNLVPSGTLEILERIGARERLAAFNYK